MSAVHTCAPTKVAASPVLFAQLSLVVETLHTELDEATASCGRCNLADLDSILMHAPLSAGVSKPNE